MFTVLHVPFQNRRNRALPHRDTPRGGIQSGGARSLRAGGNLTENFETPFGLELLSTVH
jgi:hypothetical protein